MIRILLADDEPVALARLGLAAATMPDIEVVATARNGRQAIEMMLECRPDIAILDIQMPGKDGFAVIDAIRSGDHVPEIIFVTAFHEHAVRAFDVSAVDYLLKPIEFERFREAIHRARSRLQARTMEVRFTELQDLIVTLRHSERGSEEPTWTSEVWVRTREGQVRVRFEDIDVIMAEGDYVSLHVGERSYLLKETMTALQSRLDPARFHRVHRSTIVNLSRIAGMRRRGPRALSLGLATGRQIAVGPSHIASTLDALHAKRWR